MLLAYVSMTASFWNFSIFLKRCTTDCVSLLETMPGKDTTILLWYRWLRPGNWDMYGDVPFVGLACTVQLSVCLPGPDITCPCNVSNSLKNLGAPGRQLGKAALQYCQA